MVMSMPGLLPRLMSGSMFLLWSVLMTMVPDTTEGLENRTATLRGVDSIPCLDSTIELTLLWGGGNEVMRRVGTGEGDKLALKT